MQSTKTTIRRVAYTAALALTALAAFASGAAGGSGANVCTARAQSCMTGAEFRALLIRSEALNRKHGLGTAR
jgi:hypothetical protein